MTGGDEPSPPENGNFVGTNHSVGATIQLECNEGYSSLHESSFTCNAGITEAYWWPYLHNAVCSRKYTSHWLLQREYIIVVESCTISGGILPGELLRLSTMGLNYPMIVLFCNVSHPNTTHSSCSLQHNSVPVYAHPLPPIMTHLRTISKRP